MDYYGSQAANQKISYDTPPCLPGELNRLSQRLEAILQGMRDVTADLACHADRLHGEQPANAAGSAKPVRSGAIGTLEDLIDMLAEQTSALQVAAGRNTSLA